MITKDKIFGEVSAYVYTIDWQKRGLPHMHLLAWLSANSRIRTDDIDCLISAEIADPDEDPELHRLVLAHMIHGPCGNVRQFPCMFREGRLSNCTKKFPKPFNNVTEVGQDSFPRYKRRHPDGGGITAEIRVREAKSLL